MFLRLPTATPLTRRIVGAPRYCPRHARRRSAAGGTAPGRVAGGTNGVGCAVYWSVAPGCRRPRWGLTGRRVPA